MFPSTGLGFEDGYPEANGRALADDADADAADIPNVAKESILSLRVRVALLGAIISSWGLGTALYGAASKLFPNAWYTTLCAVNVGYTVAYTAMSIAGAGCSPVNAGSSTDPTPTDHAVFFGFAHEDADDCVAEGQARDAGGEKKSRRLKQSTPSSHWWFTRRYKTLKASIGASKWSTLFLFLYIPMATLVMQCQDFQIRRAKVKKCPSFDILHPSLCFSRFAS